MIMTREEWLIDKYVYVFPPTPFSFLWRRFVFVVLFLETASCDKNQ